MQGVSSVECTLFIACKKYLGGEKMKEKLLLTATAILMTAFFAVGLAACKPSDEETAHEHQMQHFDAVAATCTEEGNSEYWVCRTCGKYFFRRGRERRDCKQIFYRHFCNRAQLGRMGNERTNVHGRRL